MVKFGKNKTNWFGYNSTFLLGMSMQTDNLWFQLHMYQGYNGLLKKGEDHIVEDTMEMLRKEIEGYENVCLDTGLKIKLPLPLCLKVPDNFG